MPTLQTQTTPDFVGIGLFVFGLLVLWLCRCWRNHRVEEELLQDHVRRRHGEDKEEGPA